MISLLKLQVEIYLLLLLLSLACGKSLFCFVNVECRHTHNIFRNRGGTKPQYASGFKDLRLIVIPR